MSYDAESSVNEFFSAVYRGDTKTLKKYLKLKVNVDFCDNLAGNTALLVAIQENQPEIVKLLLDYGANTDLKNYDGYDALGLAKLYQHEDGNAIVELITKHINF